MTRACLASAALPRFVCARAKSVQRMAFRGSLTSKARPIRTRFRQWSLSSLGASKMDGCRDRMAARAASSHGWSVWARRSAHSLVNDVAVLTGDDGPSDQIAGGKGPWCFEKGSFCVEGGGNTGYWRTIALAEASSCVLRLSVRHLGSKNRSSEKKATEFMILPVPTEPSSEVNRASRRSVRAANCPVRPTRFWSPRLTGSGSHNWQQEGSDIIPIEAGAEPATIWTA